MKTVLVAAMLSLPAIAGATEFVLPPLPSMTEPAANEKPEKVICRTEAETGSLVKRIRRCGNAAMWKRSAEAGRTLANDIADQKGRYQFGEGAGPSNMAEYMRQFTVPGGQ